MSRAQAFMAHGLIHRCTITPAGAITYDPDTGQPIAGAGAGIEDIPCRLTDLTDEEVINARQEGTARYTDALLLPIATAISPQSTVSAITLARTGAPVDDGPFGVVDVTTRNSDQPEYLRALINRMG